MTLDATTRVASDQENQPWQDAVAALEKRVSALEAAAKAARASAPGRSGSSSPPPPPADEPESDEFSDLVDDFGSIRI